MNSSNIKIAKNTLYLYLRTIIVLCISLYSSRLLLMVLGEVDLGIYNLVGGIVALMAFFQSAQAKATSRFITYELGISSNSQNIKRIFSACISIHLLIIIFVFIFAESLGLWVVNKFIEIPENRCFAANIVYQCSLIIFCINLMRVPYDAVIIAHEEMSVYAYLTLAEALLQLLVILVLQFWGSDNLILYGIFLVLLSFFNFLGYYLYVIFKHKDYPFALVWDKNISKRILSFSGWTLIGSTANTATQQGLGLLLNKFVGIVANTALGFAYQINGAVSKFVSSYTTAFNPQIIKLYAQKDWNALFLMMYRASKFSFILAYTMALPLILNMDYVLQLWLVKVPPYTTGFCQLILICSIIDATSSFLNTSITATGIIRNYQILLSISFLADIFCSFILLLLGFNPIFVFGSRIFTRGLINMIIGLYISNKLLNFCILKYIKEVILPIFYTIVISLIPNYYCLISYTGLNRLVTSLLCGVSITIICTWFFICNKSERFAIKSIVNKVIISSSLRY